MSQEPIVYIMPILLLGFIGYVSYFVIKANLPHKKKK